jgi:hypothetical protein
VFVNRKVALPIANTKVYRGSEIYMDHYLVKSKIYWEHGNGSKKIREINK